MSTYQYYEFMVLDGPISDEGLRYAQTCSSRAEVSRYRWVNSYRWGDFSGSEEQLLAHYDAFYYFADYGRIRFALAFSEGCLAQEFIEPYLTDEDGQYFCGVMRTGEAARPLLIWDYTDEEGCWDEPDEIAGILGRLACIREQLMQGDARALFIGWLAQFNPDWIEDEDAVMPPVPCGMGALNDGLMLLAEELQVDESLLRAASVLSAPMPCSESLPIRDVVDALSVSEMKSYLVRVAEGDGGHVRAELVRKICSQKPVCNDRPMTCRAFADRVLMVQEELAIEYQHEKERAQQEAKQQRTAHLDRVLARSATIWKSLDQQLVKKSSSVYDRVFTQLEDLFDAYLQAGKRPEFMARYSRFRSCYANRPALIRRLDKLNVNG